MTAATQAADLPPFDYEHAFCRMCGGVRGRSERWPLVCCLGNEPDEVPRPPGPPRGPTCRYNVEGEHLHLSCVLCGHTWPIQAFGGEPPLTSIEIRAMRELMAPQPESGR